MWQSAAENFFRRRALGGGIELNQQAILLWRDAFKADAVGIEMMPDGETVRHSDTLANRAYRQRGLLLLHRQPKPEQGAEQKRTTQQPAELAQGRAFHDHH